MDKKLAKLFEKLQNGGKMGTDGVFVTGITWQNNVAVKSKSRDLYLTCGKLTE